MKKRSFFVFFILSFLLIITGCNQGSSNSTIGVQADEDSVIRFGLYNLVVTFDPRYATDAISSRLNRLLYQQLVDFNEQSQAVPSLATWNELSPIHFRFTLKPDIRAKFHNDQMLTMEDVKATFDSILNNNKVSPHKNAITHIQAIKLINPSTLDFHLSRADPLFPSLLTMGVLPKKLIDKNHPFNTSPIGSGNFEFIAWPYDTKIEMKRRKDNQRFEFHSIKDPTVRVLKLINGEVDIIQNNLPSEQIGFLKQYQSIKYSQRQGSNYSYIGFNLQDKDVGQLKIRQAIAMAIDRDRIIEYVLGNSARKANGFFPLQHWLSSPKLKQLDYAPEKAKKLMNELGYNKNSPLKLTFKTSSNPFSIRKASVIQQQLKAVYIDLSIKSYDWGTFYSDIKSGKFQLYSLEWVGVKSPDIFKYIFHSQSLPPKGANRGRLVDKQVDQLIERADKELDVIKKRKLYQQLQEHLTKQLVYVSLWYMSNISFFQTNVTGYQVASDGAYDGLNEIKLGN